jgi:hypothetical protein
MRGRFVFGGARQVPSLNLRGESPRSDLHWLHLAMRDF